MTDANLEIRVNTSEVDRGDQALQNLAATGARAEASLRGVTTASDALAAAHRMVGSAAGQAAGAARQATSASETLAAATREARGEMGEMVGAIQATIAADMALARASNEVARAQAAVTSAAREEARAFLSGANPALQRAATSSTALAREQRSLGRQVELTTYQMTNLSFQLNDVVTGLASGQRPMQIFAQQAGQIFQALQQGPNGLGGSLSALARMLTGMPALITAVVVSLAAIGTAAYLNIRAVGDMERATYGLGAASGLTGRELQGLAEIAAETAGVSDRAAEKMIQSYMRLGITAPGVLREMTTLTKDYALITGEKMKDAQKELGAAIQDPLNGIDDLANAIGGVDGRTSEYIKTLAREGRLDEARAAMLDVLRNKTDGIRDSVDGMSAALTNAGNGWSNFWKGVGQFFSGGDPESISARFPGAEVTQDQTAKANAREAGERERLNRLTREGAAAYQSLVPHLAQVQKIQGDIARVDRLLEAGQEAINKSGHTRVELEKAKAEALKRVKDLNMTEEEKKAAREAESAAKAAQRRAEALSRELRSMQENAAGQLVLAEAYLVSGSAAMQAEASRKGEVEATTKRGEAARFQAAELALAIGEVAKAGAQQHRSLVDATAAQVVMNQAMMDGEASYAALLEQRDIDIATAPLNQALKVADARQTEVLKRVIDQLTKAIHEKNLAEADSAALASSQRSRQDIEVSRQEVLLLGLGNAERARKIAQLQTINQLSLQPGFDPQSPATNQAVKDAQDAAEAQANAKAATDAYNQSLNNTLDLLRLMNEQAGSLGQTMAEAFGRPGQALGNLMTMLTGYEAQKEEWRREEEEAIKRVSVGANASDAEKAASAKRVGEIQVIYAERARNAQLKSYGDMLGSAKGFFKESSAGYKTLELAEKAFRAVELAMSLKSMAQKAIETASHVAKEGIKQAASSATAIASSMAGWPFPLNLAAAGATLTALLAVGAAVKGAISGGGGVNANVSQDRQAAQGTGSVLGDMKAQSQSLSKSLEMVAANTNTDLEYSNEMLQALRSIDSQIGNLTASLARQLGAGGMLDTSGLGLGSTINGPSTLTKILNPIAAILPGLFGKKTTKTLLDSGLQFDSASLGSILQNGVSGNAYMDVATQTKKKFLGITTSNKTKTTTETTALEEDFARQVQLLLKTMKDSLLTAAGQLGIEGADATLNAFNVALGTISLKDMDADQIAETLQGVFSKVGDQMAETLVPSLSQFQRAGEGMYETLVRLSTEYRVVDTSLQSINMVFGKTGLASLEARDRLVQLVGGLDALQDATQKFAEDYLTQAERMAPIQANVTAEMNRLGLSSIKTKEQFKQLVQGIDTTTAEGAQLFASLMAVAPAFAKVQEYLDSLAPDGTSMDVYRQRRSLEADIAELLGRNEEALTIRRQMELDAIDKSLWPLQQRKWALEDEAAAVAKAAKEAEELRQRMQMLTSLQVRLAQAYGNEALATQLRRQQELASATDDAARALLNQIYIAEDLAKAVETAQKAYDDATSVVDKARSELLDAYNRESKALEDTRDQFQGFADDLKEFLDSLSSGPLSQAGAVQRRSSTMSEFNRVYQAAMAGDKDAYGKFTGAAQAFLEASSEAAATSVDYQRDLAFVRNATDQTRLAALDQVDYAKEQLDALKALVSPLVDINSSVTSVAQAIQSLSDALAAQAAAQAQLDAAKAAQAAGAAGASGYLTPGYGMGGQGSQPQLSQAEKDKNNANFMWILANSMAGRAMQETGPQTENDKYVLSQANRYQPGYMDIVNTQGIEKANDMVSSGQLSYFQGGALKYATGGSFEVGGVGGVDSQRIKMDLTPGEVVNIRRGDQEDISSVRRSVQELDKRLTAQNEAIAINTSKFARLSERWEKNGIPVRAVDPTQPIQVVTS